MKDAAPSEKNAGRNEAQSEMKGLPQKRRRLKRIALLFVLALLCAGVATPGFCPGPAEIQCCTPSR